MTWLRRVATVALISLLALAALWVALGLAGLDATHALIALWDGSFGSGYALTSSRIRAAMPTSRILSSRTIPMCSTAGARCARARRSG